MKKKVVVTMLTAAMVVASFAGCGNSSSTAQSAAPASSGAESAAPESSAPAESAGSETADAPAASGELIKVGIINNDPNESGYRTANDADLKAMFNEENGYDASFAYSLKNDEQITCCYPQPILPVGTAYCRMPKMPVSRLSSLTVPSMLIRAFTPHLSYPTWIKKVKQLLTGWRARDLTNTM